VARIDDPDLTMSSRLQRDLLLAFAGLVLLAFLVEDAWIIQNMSQGSPGADLADYQAVARRVLAGGSLYLPYQVAGPYVTVPGDSMYPPYVFPLFAVFTVAPAFLWWAIPIAILAWSIWALRPSPLGWIWILSLIAFPYTWTLYWSGNPVMWVAAGMGLAMHRSWWALAVFVKPSLFPFAIWGIRERSWWVGAAVLGLASLAVLPLTLEWFAVILNARGHWAGFLYGLPNAPLLLVPVAAWFFRSDRVRDVSVPARNDERSGAVLSVPGVGAADAP
jgi:hypothetical protein